MTQEQKAKAYDEAIRKAQDIFHTSEFIKITDLFPELTESEDERIRKAIIHYILYETKGTISEATEHTWVKWLEKQKDASKAIEAVDRIDRYIDEHVANAHDMKDSNPDKKYYRGWDDALGKMSGILQDVYSGKKQKEQEPVVTHGETYRVDTLGTQQVIAGKMPQKPIECIEFDNEFEKQVSHLLASVLNGEWEYNEGFVKHAAQSLLGYAKNELKQEPFSCGHENGKPADSVFSKQEYESSPIISTDTTSVKPVERSLEDDHIIGFVYDLLNEVEWKDDWAMSKEECLRLLSNYSPQKITGVTINGEPISTENQSVDIPLAEWSEEDKKMLNHLIDKIQENLNIRMPDGYSFGISNDEKETFSSWLRCLPERFNLQPNQEWSEEDEAAYNAFICEVVNEKMNPTIEQVKWLRGICDRLKSFYSQSKQEWNNEDESMLNTIITDVGFVQRKCGIGTDEWNVRSKAIQWLKNLLERFNLPKQEWKEVELEFRGEKVKIKRPFFRDDKGREYSTTEQDEDVAWYALRAWCNKKGISLYDLYPKNEWSEEDEHRRDGIIQWLREYQEKFNPKYDSLSIESIESLIDWLKSLRPSWKPSEAQMEALKAVIDSPTQYQCIVNELKTLYDELKKL